MHRLNIFPPLFSLTFLAACTDDELPRPAPFTVSGTVTADNGQMLQGVTVNSVADTVLTDSLGRFTVESHPRGGIEFSKNGFQNWVKAVNERDSLQVSLLKIPPGGGTLPVTVVEVKDFGQGTGNATWTADKVWVLRNRVFVNEGQTLTIQPGTIVKAAAGQGESAAALVVARGGRIVADGTSEAPIIFTALGDPILRLPDGSLCLGTSLTPDDRGLWGGVVLLGRATLNAAAGETSVEGLPTSEARGLYGGPDDADDSGILRHVSIRHAGTQLGLGNELNGLTLAGVGSGTVAEFVETFATADDGFQFFGGTVNTRYLVSAFNADDAFDYDEGWRGKNQFWFAFQTGDSDRGGEHRGGTGQPFATPVIFQRHLPGPRHGHGQAAAQFCRQCGRGIPQFGFPELRLWGGRGVPGATGAGQLRPVPAGRARFPKQYFP